MNSGSGIGPGSQLRNLGIVVRHELEGVGRNLQDHLDVCTLFQCKKRITYDHLNEMAVALRYLFDRRGPGSSNVAEAVATFKAGELQQMQPHMACAHHGHGQGHGQGGI